MSRQVETIFQLLKKNVSHKINPFLFLMLSQQEHEENLLFPYVS